MKKSQILSLIVFLVFGLVLGQAQTPSATKSPTTSMTKTSTKKEKEEKPKFKKYDEVITKKAFSDEGLFKVHKVDKKYYFEIPDTLLGKEMLVVSRYVKTPIILSGSYGGEETNEQVWKWEKKDDKIFIRIPSYQIVAEKDTEMYESVKNSNFEPILASFNILTFNHSKTTSVIDVSSFFKKDIKVLGIPKYTRKRLKVGSIDTQRSYLDTIRAYPINIEIRSVKTYYANNIKHPSNLDALSIEFNHSMILLPEKKMKVRFKDPRVGFFAQTQTDYSIDDQTAKKTQYIRRWRLEPSNPNAYKRGRLVEPKKKITYYIDPATPQKWRPYIKAGVNDWNVAFERAGFKNAIQCLDPPTKEENPDWSAEDARYSVIRYFASPIQNAYGPHIADPRTGEILESDIGWFHNIMRLLRNWYFIQTAAVNPEARGAKFKDEVLGELMRFVAAHEVGHTLGLPHNWGASYAVPVESLRSKKYMDKLGGTAPSIMDYARFNYVTQPEDKGVRLTPGIGEYDKWSVQWGYLWFDESLSAKDEFKKLSKMVGKKAENPMYFYGAQSRNIVDPRAQREDLGNNPTTAGKYGIANLKKILPNIEKWTFEENEFLLNLDELYYQVITQWNRYIGHSINWVGGIYKNYKTYEQSGAVFEHAEREKQQNNLKFVIQQGWNTPQWLLNKDVLSRIDNNQYVEKIMSFQKKQLNSVLKTDRLKRVLDNELKNNDKAYRLSELFTDIREAIWKELYDKTDTDRFRRSLQRNHIDNLANIIEKDKGELRAYARAELKEIQKISREYAENKSEHYESKIHAVDIDERITEIFKIIQSK